MQLLYSCSCLPCGEEEGAVFSLVAAFRISNSSWKDECRQRTTRLVVFVLLFVLNQPGVSSLQYTWHRLCCIIATCTALSLSWLAVIIFSLCFSFVAVLVGILSVYTAPFRHFYCAASALMTNVFAHGCSCSLNQTNLCHFKLLMLYGNYLKKQPWWVQKESSQVSEYNRKQHDTLKYVGRKSCWLSAVPWKKSALAFICFTRRSLSLFFFFAPARLKYVELFLITLFGFSTERFTSLARSWPSSARQIADGVVRRCRAPQCRFVLACPWERDCRVSACAGVFSPTVDHPSSVVTGSSLPHSPWPTSPALTPPPLSSRLQRPHVVRGARKRRPKVWEAPSVNRTTFIFPNSRSYYIRHTNARCYLPAATT